MPPSAAPSSSKKKTSSAKKSSAKKKASSAKNTFNPKQDIFILRAVLAHRDDNGALPSGEKIATAVKTFTDSAGVTALSIGISGRFSNDQIRGRFRNLKFQLQEQVERARKGKEKKFKWEEDGPVIFKLSQDIWGPLVVEDDDEDGDGDGDGDGEGECDDDDNVDLPPNTVKFQYAKAAFEEIVKINPMLNLEYLLSKFDSVDEATARGFDNSFKDLHMKKMKLDERERELVEEVEEELEKLIPSD